VGLADADAEAEAEADAEADADATLALTLALALPLASPDTDAEAEADTLVELALLLAVLVLTGKISGIPSLTSNQNLPIPVSFLIIAWKKNTFGTVLMASNIWPLAGKPRVARNWQVARVHEVVEEEEEVQ
jgi:hypothetical protein